MVGEGRSVNRQLLTPFTIEFNISYSYLILKFIFL